MRAPPYKDSRTKTFVSELDDDFSERIDPNDVCEPSDRKWPFEPEVLESFRRFGGSTIVIDICLDDLVQGPCVGGVAWAGPPIFKDVPSHPSALDA